jgi:hypothetical protein
MSSSWIRGRRTKGNKLVESIVSCPQNEGECIGNREGVRRLEFLNRGSASSVRRLSVYDVVLVFLVAQQSKGDLGRIKAEQRDERRTSGRKPLVIPVWRADVCPTQAQLSRYPDPSQAKPSQLPAQLPKISESSPGHKSFLAWHWHWRRCKVPREYETDAANRSPGRASAAWERTALAVSPHHRT